MSQVTADFFIFSSLPYNANFSADEFARVASVVYRGLHFVGSSSTALGCIYLYLGLFVIVRQDASIDAAHIGVIFDSYIRPKRFDITVST